MKKLVSRRAPLAALILCVTSIAWCQSAPVITSVSSGFGGLPFVSPNGLARVNGTGLADAAGFDFTNTKIFVNGVQALGQSILVDATNTNFQVAFQKPPQTPLGPGSFVVSHKGISSAAFAFPITQHSPPSSGVVPTPLPTLQ